jgi:FRG domain
MQAAARLRCWKRAPCCGSALGPGADRRYKRLINWVSVGSMFGAVSQSDTQALARRRAPAPILHIQHDGIPTNCIDFTTDPAVAGFFAADTKAPPTEGMSCIYCLDTKNLLEVTYSVFSRGRLVARGLDEQLRLPPEMGGIREEDGAADV